MEPKQFRTLVYLRLLEITEVVAGVLGLQFH